MDKPVSSNFILWVIAVCVTPSSLAAACVVPSLATASKASRRGLLKISIVYQLLKIMNYSRVIVGITLAIKRQRNRKKEAEEVKKLTIIAIYTILHSSAATANAAADQERYACSAFGHGGGWNDSGDAIRVSGSGVTLESAKQDALTRCTENGASDCRVDDCWVNAVFLDQLQGSWNMIPPAEALPNGRCGIAPIPCPSSRPGTSCDQDPTSFACYCERNPGELKCWHR
jgi:hypothetical protein